MENYKSILQQQRDALTKDIEQMQEEINDKEILLEAQKRAKSLAVKELKAIEKKLSKIS